MTSKPTKGQTITTWVLSILKILTGIIVIVLYKVVLDKALEIRSTSISQPSIVAFYIFGLPFLVPGVFGLVAAFTKNAVAYGLYMAVCIIACVVDAVFCFIGFAFLFAMASVGGLNCHNVAGQCVCSIVHFAYGLSAILIIGWILCLAGSIVSCASCCCGQREPQVVMMQSYPGQAVNVNHYQPPTYTGAQYAPPPSDTVDMSAYDQGDKNHYKLNRMY